MALKNSRFYQTRKKSGSIIPSKVRNRKKNKENTGNSYFQALKIKYNKWNIAEMKF